MLKPSSSSTGYGIIIPCVVLDGMGRSLIVLVLLKLVAGWLKMSASSWGASTLEMLESLAAVPSCGSHEVNGLSWINFDRQRQVVGAVNLGL